MAVGDLYTISELCGSWQALWRLASSVAAGKLWRLAICTPLTSCVAVGKLYTVGKLCGSWQAVAVGKLYTIGKPCGSWEAMW